MFVQIVLVILLGLTPTVAFHLLIRWLQNNDVAAGLIPPRWSTIIGTAQRFLYMQDFHTMTWGDLVGLSMVWSASLTGASSGWSNSRALTGAMVILLGATIGLMAGMLFHQMCLRPDHKPDYGFPSPGKSSTAGLVHSVFFGLSFWVGTTGLLFFIMFWKEIQLHYNATLLAWVYAVGFIIWLAAGLADLRAKKFEPLRLLPNHDTCPRCGSEKFVPELPGKRCRGCGQHY